MDSEGEERRARQPEARRQVVGEAIEEERVGPERQMRSPGPQRTRRKDQGRVGPQTRRGIGGGHFDQSDRTGHLTTPSRWAVLVAAAAIGALAEWIRAPSAGWAIAAAGLALIAAVGVAPWRGGLAGRALAALLVATAGFVPLRQAGISALARDWPAEREARIEAASQRLEGDLREALRRISGMAGQAAELARLPDEVLFRSLPRLVSTRGVETGVAIFREDGSLRAWAGRHRLPPEPPDDSLGVRSTAYVHVFESRRLLPDGGAAVASLLLDADEALPGAERSLTSRFQRRTEVGLRVYPPGLAPDGDDIFDYEEPTTAGPRVLFSVRTVPPTEGEATLRAMERAARLGALLVVGVVVLALLAVPRPGDRGGLLVLLLWVVSRAPVLDALGLDLLASPAHFYREFPPGLSLVAGQILVAGFVATSLGIWWWGASTARSRWRLVPGAVLLLGAPFLVRALGQGITPPVEGVTVPLWLTWQVSILLATAGLVIPAAALLRPRRESAGMLAPLAGAVLACVAAALGLWAWEGRSGWPDWYTLLWVPALVLVTRPAVRWATILGIAVVAGSAASLMTWGAELEGRVELARRDLMHLGPDPEPLAEPMLRGLSTTLRAGPGAGSAAGLLVAWRRSGLDRQGYPARLELRDTTGALRLRVALDALDLPDTLVAARLLAMPPGQADTIVAVARTPGVHFLLLQRQPEGVVVAALGPRTQVTLPERLGRLVHSPAAGRPAYGVVLGPGTPVPGTEVAQVRWRRQGWQIRGERTVQLPGGPRQAFATVDMLGPLPLLVRGALVLFLNIMLLALVWRGAELLAGGRLRLPPWSLLGRSFRAQLSVALGVFFVVPAAIFAGWSVVRLNADALRSRQSEVSQVLRDALAGTTAGELVGPRRDAALREAAARVDAELALYLDGRLVTQTSDLLPVFTLVPPVVHDAAWRTLHLPGERDALVRRAGGGGIGMVGYRAFGVPGSEQVAILASPQAAGDPLVAEQQRDLLLALLLASLVGVVAALLGSQVAARRLSRPVADLRRAALAFGEGRGLADPSTQPPVEFEPVFAAFKKMAADVRANQEAQEHAARVLAWGEMARQVAHEIKNPLTPMRLGLQHLQRVWRERQDRLGPELVETAPRILSEIDRLDRIARSFSRYGAPEGAALPLEPVILGDELRELLPLYRFGEGELEVRLEVGPAAPVLARRDEVKEVLLNLVENARNAGARQVVVRVDQARLEVEDDGVGIAPEVLARIFEPRFSATTSGAGLGLAIVRRLVEGWGASIVAEPAAARGARFVIRFPSDGAPAVPPP